MIHPKPLHARLWAKVKVVGGDGCWEWQGATDRRGYGGLLVGGRGTTRTGAHRVAWLVTYGPIPPGIFVCHRCDNPLCCRPDHLFLGTHADNMADMTAKHRQKGQDRFSDDVRRAAVEEWRSGASSQQKIADRLGVSQRAVSKWTQRFDAAT